MKVISLKRAKKITARLETTCREFLEAIERVREGGKPNFAHGPDHDQLVAGYAVLIAGHDRKLVKKAWAAARVHSVDRMLGKKGNTRAVVSRLLRLLPKTFTRRDRSEILLAVMRHSGPNQPEDNWVQVVLQDADRLANLGPALIIRAGQHYPNIPTLELGFLDPEVSNPSGTFKLPASCRDDVRNSLDFENNPRFWLRTPVGRALGRKYFAYLRQFLAMIRDQYAEVGLV